MVELSRAKLYPCVAGTLSPRFLCNREAALNENPWGLVDTKFLLAALGVFYTVS